MTDNKIFILIAMIFLHIIDDYKLQGILASMKQKKWWKEQNDYKSMYKYDYIIALLTHSFSWSFMIMLPIAFALKFDIGFQYGDLVFALILLSIADRLKGSETIFTMAGKLVFLIMAFISSFKWNWT